MPTETRTSTKTFNKALLTEELAGSSLPFLRADFYGFSDVGRYEASPRTEDRVVKKSRRPDGSYSQDVAAPGEIRFEFTKNLTVAQNAELDNLLLAHEANQRTGDQQRQDQDDTDLDFLIANHPDIDTFTDSELRSYIGALARAIIREKRAAPI